MWYYTVNNQQVGPVDEAEIKNLVAAGTITQGTMVWTSGMANWQLVSQTPLASLLGPVQSQIAAYAPAAVYEDPEVTSLKTLFMWFWISLIAILIGIGIISAIVLFFIILWKAWKLVQREGIRCTPDQAVAYCGIPGWQCYWLFPATRGLAKEFNEKFTRENIAQEQINLDLPTWMLICLYASPITFGISLIPFIVLWIMYTIKIKDASIAVIQAKK